MPWDHTPKPSEYDMTTSTNFQDEFYSAATDYRHGSPHLTHLPLYNKLVKVIDQQLQLLVDRGIPMHVVEIGAGHGAFTEPMLAVGSRVTALEMAHASVETLSSRFGKNPLFTSVHSQDGSMTSLGRDYSMAAFVSVLHHIPDYVGALRDAVGRIRPGGALIALHEPLWYPRASKLALYVNKIGYFSWRARQGAILRGIATQARRLRGEYDQSNPSDMVEYHVVRQGVDEESIVQLLTSNFESVKLIKYWSNQSSLAQRFGERLSLENTFGLVASGRLA
jgi:2-polyprenyl-3-methyl-5-hydroxy-6-metoxy-1,4-benzoquinol methylase